MVTRRDFFAGACALGCVATLGRRASASPPRQAVFDLAHPIPLRPRPGDSSAFTLLRADTHLKTHGLVPPGPSHASWTSEDVMFSTDFGGTCVDALGATGRNLKLARGRSAVDASSIEGLDRDLSIAAFPLNLAVTRGILLDVAGTRGHDALPPGFRIGADDLKAAARVHRDLGTPESVLIRTGWGAFFRTQPETYHAQGAPGLTLDAAKWLVTLGAAVVGIDLMTLDGTSSSDPSDLYPAQSHVQLEAGAYVVRNLYLEDLAAHRLSAFSLVLAPLNVAGASGSPIRVIATSPSGGTGTRSDRS